MKHQEFTSKNTSVNSRNLPSAFRKFGIASGDVVLDYGCGRYWEKTLDYCYSKGAAFYIPYDKYNCSELLNQTSLDFIINFGADKIFCCNVLNVIKEDEIVQEVVDTCLRSLKAGGMAIFQIYTGNGSGNGAPTKNDCYQRNSVAKEYERFFEKYDISGGWYIRYTKCFVTVNRDLPF